MVGVHSPKFVHETDHDAVVAAVERYEVHHPVLDDPDLVTWEPYAVRAWPTLAVVDPEGYVVAQLSGEGHAHGLDAAARRAGRRARGARAPCTAATGRTCPAAAADDAALPRQGRAAADGHVLVADAGHHQLVELARVGRRDAARPPIGSGQRGLLDGPPDVAALRRAATGCACCRPTWRPWSATTSSSRTPSTMRCAGSSLIDGTVTTVAGTGSQWMHSVPQPPDGAAREQDLSSPWDVVWSAQRRRGAGRDGRHPPAVGLRPGRAPGPAVRRHDATRACATGRWTRRGSRRRRAWRSRPTRTASGCGSPTPRRPACARCARTS